MSNIEMKQANALRILELIRNADCIRFDNSPNLFSWHTMEADDVDFDILDDIVVAANSEDSNSEMQHTLELGQLLDASIVDGKLVYSDKKPNDSFLQLSSIKSISFDETPVESEVLEAKWKAHGLGQVLSSWNSGLSDEDLYDLLQDTGEEELDALFEEHDIDVWQPFETDEKSQVCEYIANAATQAQAVANA